MYRRSNLVHTATTGANTHPVSSPSHQFSRMSRITTAVNVTTLVTKKTRPNPANRRIADRSVVARDSSWPDCHASWKPTCSRCTCAYKSPRIVRSMPVTAPPCTQRRISIPAASARPRPIVASESGISSPRRSCAIAPSITDLVSSGMVSWAATVTSAAASITASCGR